MTDKSVLQTASFKEVREHIKTCPREELNRYISDLIFSCNAENQDIHDAALHQGYIALLQKHIPDQGRLKEILTEIARQYITCTPIIDPAIAMLYIHVVLTDEIIDPKKIQRDIYDNLQVQEKDQFIAYLDSIEPYFQLLFGNSLADLTNLYYTTYLPQRDRDEYERNKNEAISDPRSRLDSRANLIERICTDPHRTQNNDDEDPTSIDRETLEYDNDGVLSAPEPGVDYITLGRVYSHRVSMLPSDRNDTQKRLTNPRETGPQFYYKLATKSNFPQHPEKVIAMIEDCLEHKVRSVIPYSIQILCNFASNNELKSMHIKQIADCLMTCIATFENNTFLAKKYENYFSLRRKKALEIYTKLPTTPDSLTNMATLGNSLGAVARYIQEHQIQNTPEPQLPESTITKENHFERLNYILQTEQYNYNLNEFYLYLEFLELAIFHASQGQIDQAWSAFERGRKRNFHPGYGQYTNESQERENKLLDYLTYHSTKLNQEYGILAEAINHYLSQGEINEYTDTYCDACLTIGKRYVTHGQSPKARDFLSLATYAPNKEVARQALKLLEKIAPEKTELYEE